MIRESESLENKYYKKKFMFQAVQYRNMSIALKMLHIYP